MIKLLTDNPLLLLFIVAAIGYPLGRIHIAGSSLGVSAVLFVGIAVGALDPRLQLPDIIYLLGLALFIYAIGLSSGRGFIASLKQKGLRDNLFIFAMLVVAMGLSLGVHVLFHMKSSLTTGMFAGALTNAPALAGVMETLRGTVTNKAAMDAMIAEFVGGFSIAYPVGVIGMILIIYTLERIWKIDYKAEAAGLREFGVGNQKIENRVVTVTRPEATVDQVILLFRKHRWKAVLGRMQRDGQTSVVQADTRFQLGDIVNLVGPSDELERMTEFIGEPSQEPIHLSRTEVDYRRVFVSNSAVAGRPINTLELPERFGAIITRVRRGDRDMVPNGATVLELGDRVRVLADRDRISQVSDFFGDSYKAVSEIDVLVFSLGLALGLLVGTIPIPLGHTTLKLGFAGGPLVVALFLGAMGRTGPFVWNMPYSANMFLRQFGMVLFLAGIGVRAGYPFISTFAQSGGLNAFYGGAIVTCVTAFLTLVIGYKLLKIPMGLLVGILAGLQTQPAILGYALKQTDNDLPNIGFATVYPVATVAKIILAQVVLSLLSR